MYRVMVSAAFSAAHRLRLPGGGYEPPHGHDWQVQARFTGDELDETGMLVDFEAVHGALTAVLEQLHHTDLNACPLMAGINPTAENVARIVFDALRRRVSRPDLLESVQVVEAPGCIAAYHPGAKARPPRRPAAVDDVLGDR